MFPVLKDARWVVVDRADPWHTANGDPTWSARFARELAFFRVDPRFQRIFEEEGISVFKRRSQLAAQG
jgi:hypothetical protein